MKRMLANKTNYSGKVEMDAISFMTRRVVDPLSIRATSSRSDESEFAHYLKGSFFCLQL